MPGLWISPHHVQKHPQISWHELQKRITLGPHCAVEQGCVPAQDSSFYVDGYQSNSLLPLLFWDRNNHPFLTFLLLLLLLFWLFVCLFVFPLIRNCIGGCFKQSRFLKAFRPAQGNTRNSVIGKQHIGPVGGRRWKYRQWNTSQWKMIELFQLTFSNIMHGGC